MNRAMRFGILIFVLVFCLGCKNKRIGNTDVVPVAVSMEYAEQISIDFCGYYTLVKIRNPWDTAKIPHTYVLLDRERKSPEELPEGTVVQPV